jgi:hypothetical protein
MAQMYGPYDFINDAAEAGYQCILDHHPDWGNFEFGFFVVLKPPSSGEKAVSYCFSEPKRYGHTGVVANVNNEVPQGYFVRAFCHTHPHNDDVGKFGADDQRHFEEATEKSPGIVFYLMNKFREIRVAVNKSEFLMGREVEWQHKPPKGVIRKC